MAFDAAGLYAVGGNPKAGTSGPPTIWAYRTTDAITTVDGAGYFDNGTTTNTGMRTQMRVGDFIFVHALAGTTTRTYGVLVVNQVTAAGIIDTSNVTAFGAIDSD